MNELLDYTGTPITALWPETILVPSVEEADFIQRAGFENIVALPNTNKKLTKKEMAWVFDYLADEPFKTVKKFIFAFPALGKEDFIEEISRRLGQERCWRVEWPKEVIDGQLEFPNHTTPHIAYNFLGSDGIKKMVDAAKPFPIEGIFTAHDVAPNILSYYEKGLPKGESVGFPHMADFYSIRPGEWTLVTGMPGSGKSEFVDAMMINLAGALDWNFAIFSPENMPFEYHMAKLLEKWSTKPFNTGPTPRMTLEEVKAGIEWINKRFHYIMPEVLTLDSILAKARALVLTKGIRGLVVDPWNELDHSRPENLSETEYISKSLTQIRQFAKAYGVHVWVVAHPTKMHKDKVSNEYPVPTPYDVSGSAHWRNKADCCLSVYRDISSDEVAVHIQKIRFKIVGKLGVVYFDYDKVTGVYTSVHAEETLKEKK